MKKLLALVMVALSAPVSASCVGNDTQEKLRVIFGEAIQTISPSVVAITKTTFKKVLAPKEEDCFPDYHPLYKNSRWFAFMPVEHLNHQNRLDPNPAIYYLTKPLPDFASVVVSNGPLEFTKHMSCVDCGYDPVPMLMTPKVSVYVDGKPVDPGVLLQARTLGQ